MEAIIKAVNARLRVRRKSEKPIGDISDKGSAIATTVDWNRVASFHPALAKLAERTEHPLEELLQRCYGAFDESDATTTDPALQRQVLKFYAKEGDRVSVKILGIDDAGKIKMSMKAAKTGKTENQGNPGKSLK